LYIKIKKLNL